MISENKYQVESKKKQLEELKEASDKIGIKESEYIESDVFDSRETKLPLLLEVYIFMKNYKQDSIDVASIASQFLCDGEEGTLMTKDWQILGRNLELKRLIDIYEGAQHE